MDCFIDGFLIGVTCALSPKGKYVRSFYELFISHTISLSQTSSLSLYLSHTLYLSLTHPPPLSHTLSLSFSHTHYLSLSLTHTILSTAGIILGAHSLFNTHSLLHTVSPTLSLSHPPPLSHTHTLFTAGIILGAANSLEMAFLGMAYATRIAKCTGKSWILIWFDLKSTVYIMIYCITLYCIVLCCIIFCNISSSLVHSFFFMVKIDFQSVSTFFWSAVTKANIFLFQLIMATSVYKRLLYYRLPINF